MAEHAPPSESPVYRVMLVGRYSGRCYPWDDQVCFTDPQVGEDWVRAKNERIHRSTSLMLVKQ